MTRRDYFTDTLLAGLLNTLNSPTQKYYIDSTQKTPNQETNTELPYLQYIVQKDKFFYGGETQLVTVKNTTQFGIKIDVRGNLNQDGTNRVTLNEAEAAVRAAIDNGAISGEAQTDSTTGENFSVYMVKIDDNDFTPDFGTVLLTGILSGTIYWNGWFNGQ